MATAAEPSTAAKLARWTRLTAERFGDQYNAARGYGRGKKWAVVSLAGEGAPDRRLAVLEAAAREAEANDFFETLALNVVRLEQNEGRDPDEAAAFLRELPRAGAMQAMTNRARGLAKPDMFYDLAAAYEATAQVIEAGQVIGTGFLVGPDLVLTAAHVAFRHRVEGDGSRTFAAELRDITFAFRPPRGADSNAFREIPLSPDPLVSSSPPFGSPPDRLNLQLSPDAEEHLDYALLRLVRQLSDIRPISINKVPDPTLNKLCFVIGYPNGGRQAWFDANDVVEVPAVGGRLWHIVNALPGMSGSCCVGEKGAIGLHEGGGRVSEDQDVRNRAVSLRAVRNHIARDGRDRLASRTISPGFAIYDVAALHAWQRKGEQLAGPEATAWRTELADRLGLSADSGNETSAFHPWFSRPVLENWIQSSRTSEDQRILFLHGERGVGKSFGIEILAAKLDEPDRDLIRLTPAEAAEWSWLHAAARIKQLEPSDVTRTEAGTLRYEQIAALLARLQEWGDTDRGRSRRPLYVAIDTQDLGLNDPQWREFLGQAAKLPWIRLFLVGLSQQGRNVVGEVLAQSFEIPAPVEIELKHAGLAELQAFARQLLAQLSREYDAAIHGELRGLWEAPERVWMRQPDVTTAEAALVALAIRRARQQQGELAAPQQPPQGG